MFSPHGVDALNVGHVHFLVLLWSVVLQVENLFDAVKTCAASHQVLKPPCFEVGPKSVVQ